MAIEYLNYLLLALTSLSFIVLVVLFVIDKDYFLQHKWSRCFDILLCFAIFGSALAEVIK